ncbi:hypothetical protein F5888DRAFT_1160219 [Russula emetica]|nr:hypothetical protein F5888DRAFT_1160219 [Russula emetica]
MSYIAPYHTSSLQSTERTDQGAISGESQWQRPHHDTVSIHILDNDSLLNVFRLYRRLNFGENENDVSVYFGGKGGWVDERWWYQLAHICRRWRNLILGSPSYLGLCLVCTYGTPVADMLAHSPPLPLVIDYFDSDGNRDITAEDEEGILLALEQRDHVRRVRLEMPIPNLQKVIIAIDEDYPSLEYLIMTSSTYRDDGMTLMLPASLQAPHLHHLTLLGLVLPTGSRIIPTAVGLTSLCLFVDRPSNQFQPNVVLQWLLLTPQLEELVIDFYFPVPNRDVERQLMRTPIITPVTLPNLRRLAFEGCSAYMEALVRRLTTPRLERLNIVFFNQLTFPIPHLLQFMRTTEHLLFNSAWFSFFDEGVGVGVYPRKDAEIRPLSIYVRCWHLDWQASSMAQICNALSQVFSPVEDLTLKRSQSSEEHSTVDLSEWRKLLRSFSNVKTLRVGDGLIEGLSHCLQLDEGEDELPSDLLPELHELTYSRNSDTDNGFASFINARQNDGRPITLVDCSSSQSLLESSSEATTITSAPSEASNNSDTLTLLPQANH